MHRSVPYYAKRLGCSEKTLTLACLSVEGRTAKGILNERTLLEAKRLLAHGCDGVAQVAQHLGFSETTNFIRFFKKYEQVTPAQFRARHTRPRSTSGPQGVLPPHRTPPLCPSEVAAAGEIIEVRVEGWKPLHYALGGDAGTLAELSAGRLPAEWTPLETTTLEEVAFLAPLDPSVPVAAPTSLPHPLGRRKYLLLYLPE